MRALDQMPQARCYVCPWDGPTNGNGILALHEHRRSEGHRASLVERDADSGLGKQAER